ncbi:hypothetical protein [Sphingomonas sp. C3-2]|uniref:hypothetical protein n=1 Tax=Sphingomonas sp. C3-2 TaxID=3062169 RepID=UPI00294B1DB2|nr:hypothetical protein [Sphingomonas sp. C3-2]WOK35694.1 hypothetical protein QYC26_11800 [Sphingomonas sp. C3-2]
MIANRFKSVGRVLTVAVAAMGLYLVTSQVAAERTELERVNRQIVTAKKDIRRLHTELGTRANLRQLERWNGEVLALTTPDADQFVGAETQLASLDRSGITPGPRYAPAAMVTAMVAIPDSATLAEAAKPATAAATPAPVAAQPTSTAAVAQRVAMVREQMKPAAQVAAARAPARSEKPAPAKPVSAEKPKATPVRTELARAEAPKPAKPKPDAPKVDRVKADKERQLARLEDKLLDDRLMGELARTARTETGRRRAQ